MNISFKTLALTALLGLLSAPALKAEEFLLKLDDVRGGSTVAGFKDQIVASGFSLALTNANGIVAGSNGGTIPGDLVLTKAVDIASPVLAQSMAAGTPFQQAVLTVRKPVKGELVVFYTITLTDLRISSISQLGEISPNGITSLTETISLRYSKIMWAVGPVKTGYDFSKNTKTEAKPSANPADDQASASRKALASNASIRPLQQQP